jgi:prevent-host-death family protein
MARENPTLGIKQVALSIVKDDLSHYLHEAETSEILITRHGKPAGILIGFASEDAWFDYRPQSDPRLAKRMEPDRATLRPVGKNRMRGINS